MVTKKKNYKTEVRMMKSKYWYYKGSDIIGEGRKGEEKREDRKVDFKKVE